MTPKAGRLIVRAARPEDREPVLRFCQHTWDWGDYIPRVWDEWLADESGRLLVGEVDGVPVAVGRAVLVSPTEAWLEGLRVDPARRRAGLGEAMSEACLAAARDLGARVVRFATRWDNYPIHRIAGRLGFRRAAVYTIEEAPALADGGPTPVPLAAADLPALSAGLSTSETHRSAAGLEWVGWRCRALTPDELERRRLAGEAFALPTRPAAGLALARTSAEGAALSVEYFDEVAGPGEALVDLALGLRRLAARRGLERVEAKAPDRPSLIAALRRAGYSPTRDPGALWVFERA